MPDRIRALYVDDEPGLLEVARLFLEQSPEFSVETEESAQAALNSPAIATCDVIISDYQMPGMDGIAFLKTVREKYGTIPFILFTGRGREEVVIEAINNGADFYLQKGGDPTAQFAELAHKIRQAVSRKRSQEELKAAYEQITASEEELRGQYEELAQGEQRVRESQEQLQAACTKLSASEEVLRQRYNEIAAAHRQIEESRQQLAEIAETVPGVVYQSLFQPGEKEEFTFLSSRVPEVFGISAERESFSERFFACLDPRDRELMARSIREAVANGAPWEYEGRFTKPSGETIWFQGLARPVRKAAGLYYNGVLLDITSRKRAEEAVIDQAAKLREAQEMAHLGFWNWDIRTGNVEWSDEVFRIFRLDKETFRPTIDSILARSPWPEEQNRAKEIVQKATESHEPGSYEQRFLRPDNSIGYYYSTFQGRYDDKGNLTAMVGTVLDITSRKKAEMELCASEDRYRSIIEYSPYGMHFYSLDPTRGLVFTGANPAADRILGVSHDQFIGKTLEEAFPGLVGTEVPRAYRSVAETGTVWDTEQVSYDKGLISGAYSVVAFRTAPGSMAAMFVDITEQKKTEEALRESSDRYSNILRTAMDGFCILTLEGRITDVNEAFCRMTGYFRNEALALSLQDIESVENSEESKSHIRKIIAQGSDRFETFFQCKDGRTINVEVSVVYSPVQGGRLITFCRDITERKKTEKALLLANLVVENSPVVIFRWKAEKGWPVVYVSQNVRQFGYTPDELISGIMPYSSLVYREDLERVAGEVERYTQERTDRYRQEYRIVTREGNIRWIEDHTVIERDENGSVMFYQGVLLDITEKKNVEESLREKTEELDRFFTASLDLFCIAGMDGIFHRLNPEWERALGYTLAEMEGHRFLDFVHPDDMAATLAAVAGLSRKESVLNFTNRYRHKDGSYRWIEWRSFPKGDLIFAAARDITERIQFEDALQQSRAELTAILEGTPVLQFVIGRDHRIIAWNKALEKYSGVPAAEVVGTDLQWRAFYPEKRPVLADLLIDNDTGELSRWYGGKLNPAPHVAGGYEATDFFPAMGPAGTWLMFTAAPIRDADGTIIGAVETLDDVTERVRATEALRTSEERLRLFIQQAPVAIAMFDTDMHYLAASRRWMGDYNLGDRDITGRSHYEIFPEIAEDLRAIHRRGLAGEVISSAEDRFVRSNGSVQWVAWEVRPWYTTGNAIGGIIIYSEDVTKRKEMEEELRESEEKYRSLVDVSPVAVAVHRDGTVIYVNPEAVRLLKCSRAEDLIGKEVLPFIHPDYHKKAREDFRRMTDDGEMIPLQEETLLATTGEPFTVEVVAKPIRYEGVPSIFVAFRDITEQKKMEAALRESEEKYRNLVENATEAIFILQDRRMVYANPRMGELLGVPAESLLEYSFLDYVWPADREFVLDRYTRRMAGEDVPTTYDFRMTGPEGKLLWVHISIAKVTWQQKPATLNLLTDITERKRAETALQEAWRKLALLNSLTRHDIRNQLITLQGFTQFAIKKEQDPAIAGFLEKIDTCATMIRGQIEFMKTYHELGVNSPSWYQLDEVVSKACIRELPCRNLCSGTEVFADPMLEKVFFNLFDNAHRHGEHATQAVVRCETTGDDLTILVEDNGIGIPDDEKEKVFSKGYGKNTGFGLFLAREILSITGITIRETGVPGTGARFEILVPRECWRKSGA